MTPRAEVLPAETRRERRKAANAPNSGGIRTRDGAMPDRLQPGRRIANGNTTGSRRRPATHG